MNSTAAFCDHIRATLGNDQEVKYNRPVTREEVIEAEDAHHMERGLLFAAEARCLDLAQKQAREDHEKRGIEWEQANARYLAEAIRIEAEKLILNLIAAGVLHGK